MALDMNKYRSVHTKNIKNFIGNKKKTGLELLSDITIFTGAHIVVCCHLIGEIEGYTPELDRAIASHIKFYNIKPPINTRRGNEHDGNSLDAARPVKS